MDARTKTIELLGPKLLKTETLNHSVKTCERCKTVIEPLISRQWFVKMSPLAKMGIDAVKKGDVKFTPKRWHKQYYHWMENLRDWPVSRQIWWGHRLPVYYCVDCQTEEGKQATTQIKSDSPIINTTKLEDPIVSVERPSRCPKCQGSDLVQDPDTFDTWFSSGQWPFTTLLASQPGDFEKFYPTSVLDTGWEIFWLWVTRMIMFGLYIKDEVPFKNVIAHGMLRDEKGQKMSKSKGNGVDPLEMIAKYGADATRLGLVSGRDVTTDWMISKNQLEDKIKSQRNFSNKIWNIARFILETENKDSIPYRVNAPLQNDGELKKLTKNLVKKVTSDLEKFKLGNAADNLYQFAWHELADKYLEDYKKGLVSYSVLKESFLTLLKLLHPFMPFVTEEIWQLLGQPGGKPLIVSSWPT